MLTCPNISKLTWWCHEEKIWDGLVDSFKSGVDIDLK
jgi:hypothetical protein